MGNTLSEIYTSNDFKDETAGYINKDGSFIYVHDWHGENIDSDYAAYLNIDDTELKDVYVGKGLPEFSATHLDDICVRIYHEPNDIQYKKLEEIIDFYLNTYDYCKVEIFGTPNNFYKIYSLYDNAIDDTPQTINEVVGNWTGYKLIQIVKNWFKNKGLIEQCQVENINSKNIFNTSTLGGFSYYSQCIPGDPENEYMKNKRNRIGKIVYMSPNKYFSLCAKMFNTTVEDLKEQKSSDNGEEYINKLKNIVLKEKKQFPMPFICLPDKQQEGLHRMYVAGELFGWDERFPVLIINKFDSLKEQLLLELNRNQLINKSKNSDNYKDTSKGRNRWERRNHSRIDRRVDQYNKIDMNTFFKKDELKVGINVHGETDDYIVTIRFNGALRSISDEIKRNNNKLEFKCVLIALQRTFNTGDVFVSCSCPDWKFRIAFQATKGGYNSGQPEIRASNITNPQDTKGAGCKHINLVIGNIDWVMKIASVINNYIHYMEEHYQRLYADVIFPRLFNMPYQRAVQLSLFDTGSDELDSQEGEIKLSNRYGRDRGQFRSDVRVNNMRNFRDPNSPKLEQHKIGPGQIRLFKEKEVEDKPILQQSELHLT